MRIGIIGSGIAGLGAAWLLSRTNRHDITLYEQNDYVGGHSNTRMTPQGVPVDTGFIVFNHVTYPNLVALFRAAGVKTEASNMSFAVSLDDGKLEYAGDSVRTLFAQKRNLFRPSFHRMWRSIVRFYREAPAILQDVDNTALTLGEYLENQRYDRGFVFDHLLPMGAAIWSASIEEMMEFPAQSFVRFFQNHGLMKLSDRPQWYTVTGGSREYVKILTAGFADRIHTKRGATMVKRLAANGVTVRDSTGKSATYDQVIIATHGDQALKLLADPSADERSVLGAFRYQPNRTILHTDARLMPKRRPVWASWNYMGDRRRGANVVTSVSYWMNRLQNIGGAVDYFVSLNPLVEPAADRVIYEVNYDHPMFSREAIEAQRRIGTIQGADRTWFCGSYCGYGFHEDAVSSGLAVAEALGAKRPWSIEESSPAFGNASPLGWREAAE
jgi:predicted NAD/FAD-binding protein